MTEAANKVKRRYIGYRIRKLYRQISYYENSYTSIKWTGPGANAQIIGDMTNPPWAVKIKMDYCQLRHIYVKYFSDLNKGIYYYNFIVDGKTCIDTKKPSFTCLRLKCNKLKITHCSMNNDSMPIRSSLNWYDYSSRHGFDFVTRDSGFQIKDYAETSTEYELLTKLLDETKIKPQNDLNANKFHFISDSKRKTNSRQKYEFTRSVPTLKTTMHQINEEFENNYDNNNAILRMGKIQEFDISKKLKDNKKSVNVIMEPQLISKLSGKQIINNDIHTNTYSDITNAMTQTVNNNAYFNETIQPREIYNKNDKLNEGRADIAFDMAYESYEGY